MRVVPSSLLGSRQSLLKSALLGVSSLALVLSAVQANADSLVVNGSFELTSNGSNLQISCGTPQCSTPATQSTTLNGWSIPAGGYSFLFATSGGSTSADQGGANGQFGNVQLWGTNNGGVDAITPSPDGGNFVASDGAFQVQPIEQTINGLVVGDSYRVSFDWAAAQQYSYTGPTTDQWSVSLGGQTEDTPVIDLDSHSFSGWESESLVFTATSSSEVLSFLANGTPGSSEPPFALLDGVQLNQTPEPGTLTFLLTGGLAGFGALNRRRLMMKARKAAK